MRAPPKLNYLAHLAEDSERFAEVLGRVDGAAPVPSCPDWSAADLLWHLGEVHWFWSRVIRFRPRHPRELPDPPPRRPGDVAALHALRHTADLVEALAAAAPEEPAWSWSDDHSVAFSYRRQAHEALIHRLDAELTAGHRTGMDCWLCSDGVDEVLRVFYGGVPPGTEVLDGDGHTLRLTAADTGRQWYVYLARIRGEVAGKHVDEDTIVVAETDPRTAADASITGTAEDLDCWLWHRPPRHAVERRGDPAALAAFQAVIASGIG
jgi:uncharacterized protein (TIGR03083 family)